MDETWGNRLDMDVPTKRPGLALDLISFLIPNHKKKKVQANTYILGLSGLSSLKSPTT